jgi:fructose-1,6-bisphosphatase/inositol monophosphatase family enzyme
MRLPDIDRVTSLIEEVASEEMLPRFRTLAQEDVRQKTGPNDLVTIVDEICERRLSDALTALLPGSLVVGEEGVAADPGVMGRLAGSDPVWIIDPLDGTWNFAHGVDRFASIVALSIDGETVAGWIHDPMSGITGRAVKGEGAYVGGRRMRVAESLPLDQMVGIATEFLFKAADREAVARLKAALAGLYNERCAGIEHLHLADGKAHVSVPGGLKPWDHVAGALLHREAGGFSAMLDGSGYGPRVWQGRMIMAPDSDSWEAVRRIWSGAEN